MKSRTYTIPDIGDILVCKHYNSKRLTIKLKAGSVPKVVIPLLMTYDMGYQFAFEKQDWIKNHLQKIQAPKANSLLLVNNEVYTTRFHTIQAAYHAHNQITRQKNGNVITLLFPENERVESEKNQSLSRAFITEVLRKEAKMYLPERTRFLASQHGFQYKNITVKNLKTRWGSCSASNNLNLNIHLMRLPEHLSDFIILHELCHTKHKNHGPLFHSLLNSLCGDEKKLNKELKNYYTQF